MHGSEKEQEALYADLLIGVTGFFRNAEAFEALKGEAFAKLLRAAAAGGAGADLGGGVFDGAGGLFDGDGLPGGLRGPVARARAADIRDGPERGAAGEGAPGAL